VIPFVYSESDAVVLLFWGGDIWALSPTTGDVRTSFGSFYKAVAGSGYADADLMDLKYAQVGNFLYLVSKDYPPKVLKRTPQSGDDDWELETLTLVVPELPEIATVAATEGEYSTINEIYSAEIPRDTRRAFVRRGYDAGTKPLLGKYSETTVLLRGGNIDLGNYPARPWQWKWTMVLRDSNDRTYETRPRLIEDMMVPSHWRVWNNTTSQYDEDFEYKDDDGTPLLLNGGPADSSTYREYETTEDGKENQFLDRDGDGFADVLRCALADISEEAAVYPDLPVIVQFPVEEDYVIPSGVLNDDGQSTEGDTVIAIRVYRGRDGRFGFVGETRGNQFVDDGQVPDFSYPPPEGTDWFSTEDDYPGALGFYEGRFFLGGTTNRPGTFWASAIDRWTDFDEIIPPRDNHSFWAELASNRSEEIRAMIPRDKLLMFTSSGEWGIAGSGQEEVVTPNSLAARQISQVGTGTVAPAEVGDGIFVLQQKGTLPKVLVPTPRGYQLVDTSLMARHLFEGYTVVDWAYAEEPHSILWVVRSDGALLSLTYVPEQQLMAWSQHEISESGLVHSVAVVPEGTEDGVYITTSYSRHPGQYFFERLGHSGLPRLADGTKDIRYAVNLDRSVTVNGIVEGNGLSIALVNEAIDSVMLDTAGTETSYTDQTTEANNATQDDVTPDFTNDDAAIYFGDKNRFQGLAFVVKGLPYGSGVGDYTVTWEFWNENDSEWQELTGVDDNSDSFKATELDGEDLAVGDVITVTFDMPPGWGWKELDSEGKHFYVRARGDGGGQTSAPTLDQVFLYRPGRRGENVTVTLDSGYGTAGDEILIKNPNDGIDVLLELVSGGPTSWTAQVKQAPEDILPDAMVGVEFEDTWGTPYRAASGAVGHLKNSPNTVKMLADGIVVDVDNNTDLSLKFPALIVTAGISYDCDFESLDAPHEKGRQKVIKAVTYELEYSRGGKVGTELGDDMREIPGRQVSDNYDLQTIEHREEKMMISAGWEETGRIALRQSEPLPMTILGLTRHVVYGGD
jgi:hypothetical protein